MSDPPGPAGNEAAQANTPENFAEAVPAESGVEEAAGGEVADAAESGVEDVAGGEVAEADLPEVIIEGFEAMPEWASPSVVGAFAAG
jgi:hypothetical protein